MTDPDARLMSQGAGSMVGYNVQTSVDARHRLIVEMEVTNVGSDLNALAPMATQAREILQAEDLSSGGRAWVFTTAGRCCSAKRQASPPALPSRRRARTRLWGFLARSASPLTQRRMCTPARQHRNSPAASPQRRRAARCAIYRPRACQGCPLKNECPRNKAGRTITRLEYEAVQERMAGRVAAHPEIMRARKGLIEHCFGTLKRAWGYDHFLCRSLKKVQVEMSLAALAYNLRRAMNILTAEVGRTCPACWAGVQPAPGDEHPRGAGDPGSFGVGGAVLAFWKVPEGLQAPLGKPGAAPQTIKAVFVPTSQRTKPVNQRDD